MIHKLKTTNRKRKTKKEAKVKAHFEELIKEHGLDFVDYKDLNINVTLTATLKALKEEVNNFIDKVNTDLTLINSQIHKERILVEYKRTLNASEAIVSVNEAVKAEEELKASQEVKEPSTEPKEEYQAPKVEAPQELLEITFTVRDTRENIVKVREFMKENNIKYE